jgi:hypothetical protein
MDAWMAWRHDREAGRHGGTEAGRQERKGKRIGKRKIEDEGHTSSSQHCMMHFSFSKVLSVDFKSLCTWCKDLEKGQNRRRASSKKEGRKGAGTFGSKASGLPYGRCWPAFHEGYLVYAAILQHTEHISRLQARKVRNPVAGKNLNKI